MTWLIGFGLGANMIGTGLIYRFGVPRYPSLEDAGKQYILMEQSDPDEKADVERAMRWSRIGVGALGFGFALQFVALFVG